FFLCWFFVLLLFFFFFFFFQAEDGIRDRTVTGVQTCALPISLPLELEGKGFFTKEIEEALRDGRIDVAVHSLKDLPTMLPAGLMLAAVPKRADPAEALVTRDAGITSIAGLVAGTKVGTSSLRRVAQIRYLRADL